MRNILVTGGAGFIGSNFIRFLLSNRPDVSVINVDCLTYAGSLNNLEEGISASRHLFVKGNIRDASLIEQVMESKQIDTIVHFAAETHVDRSIRNPQPFFETNIQGTFTLLEAARKHWKRHLGRAGEFRFHHISTDEVYGSLESDADTWKEDAPYHPTSPYAASKAAADHLVRSYWLTYGLPVTLTNCTNNYGPYQFPEKLIPLAIHNAIRGLSIPLYGDGTQLRDWLYVVDHCEGILAALEKGNSGESYHLSSGSQTQNIQLLQTICMILDEVRPVSSGKSYSEQISNVTDRPGHDRRYALDSEKAKKELGWQAKTNLLEGLRQTIIWYLEHPAWLQAVITREEYRRWIEEQYTS